MSNETNRTAIVLLAALWIILMAVVIFAAWVADAETVERLGDFVQYLDNHRDNASRLIVTLGALVLIVLSLLVIIMELAPPEQEARQIKVEQAGATTIIPAEPLRLRLEEVLTAMAQITAARTHVFPQDNGIGIRLDLTVAPGTDVASVTEEASRVVTETLQSDLGLAPSTPPTVQITFGTAEAEPLASSVAQPPAQEPPGAPARWGEAAPEPDKPTPPPVIGTPSAYEAPTEPPPGATTESEGPPEPPSPAPGPEAPPPAESPPHDETQQH